MHTPENALSESVFIVDDIVMITPQQGLGNWKTITLIEIGTKLKFICSKTHFIDCLKVKVLWLWYTVKNQVLFESFPISRSPISSGKASTLTMWIPTESLGPGSLKNCFGIKPHSRAAAARKLYEHTVCFPERIFAYFVPLLNFDQGRRSCPGASCIVYVTVETKQSNFQFSPMATNQTQKVISLFWFYNNYVVMFIAIKRKETKCYQIKPLSMVSHYCGLNEVSCRSIWMEK